MKHSKEYQWSLIQPIKKKKSQKSQGKTSAEVVHTDSDTEPSAAEPVNLSLPSQIAPTMSSSSDKHTLVCLTTTEIDLLELDETDIDYTNMSEAQEWKEAHEKAVAQAVGLTWHEKSHADAEGLTVGLKDEAFYMKWKASNAAVKGKRRHEGADDTDGPLPKKRK